METVSISSKTPISLEMINDTLGRRWRVENVGKQLIVQHSASRVYLYLDTPARLLLDYSDMELVKRVLEEIADDAELMVDNDFGTVLPGNQFVAKIKFYRTWNWRSEASPPLRDSDH